MLHGQERMCDLRSRWSCLVETAEVGPIAGEQPAIGVAAGGD